VVFDKTGTLTVGKPRVTRVLCGGEGGDGEKSGVDRLTLLSMAAAVERNSRHPLAVAVAAAAEAAAAPPRAVADETFRQTPGKGAVGVVDGVSVAVGTRAFCESFANIASPSKQTKVSGSDSFAAKALRDVADVAARKTPVFVAFDGTLVGVLEMEDEIRDDAAATVRKLKHRGVRVMLLSGDRQETAGAVGAALGLDAADAMGDVAPEGKAAFVAQLKSSGARVAMVGDGINDAAALAEADVGIAMAGGVGAASEVASIVLLGDRPSQVVDALELSRATFGKIEQNLCWAFAYNLVGIPIAAGALLPFTGLALTPSVAGGLMGFSSLGVMANSLLLRLAGRRLSKPPAPGAKPEGKSETNV
jgi:Cu2+-exporting ATPase